MFPVFREGQICHCGNCKNMSRKNNEYKGCS